MKRIIFLFIAAGLFAAVGSSSALAEQIVCQSSYAECNAACTAAGGTCFDRSCSWSGGCPTGSVSQWCTAEFGSSYCQYDGTSAAFCKCTSPVSAPPKGWHDSSDCTASYGWTCDVDDYAQALDVHFYKDGPAGTGTFMGSVSANQAREAAVGTECGGNSNHGFTFNTPDSLKDGVSHTIYAYAIDIPITTGLTNPLLSGSPKTFTCTDTTAPSVTGTYSPSSPSTSDKITFSASASDASGIEWTGVLVSGVGSYSCSGASCSKTWGPFSSGNYTFKAYAWDSSPNYNYGYSEYNVCVPKPSCSAGKNCGTEENGCGGTINCGTCTNGQVCYKPSGSTSGTCADPHWVDTGTTDLSVPAPCAALTCQYPSGCNADGTCAYSCSATGNSCTSGKCYSCACDTSPPVTSISLNPAAPNGINSWYVSQVTASVTCSDVGSGCEKITYTTDNGAHWYDASASSYNINLGDGVYYVKAYSTDKATLVGSTASAPISPIKVDTGAPSVSVTANPSSVTSTWQKADASASVGCSDSGSGCDSGTYRLKIYSSNQGCSGNYNDYTLASPSTISSHVWVCAAAKDNAGNIGFSSQVEFLVDQIPPQVNPYGIPFSPCALNPVSSWIDCSASPSLNSPNNIYAPDGCSDYGSGCNPASYGFIRYYAQPASCPPISQKSSYSSNFLTIHNLSWVCGYAEDNVGNAAVSAPTKFLVNRTFTIVVDAKAYGEIDVPAGTEVKGYLCEPSQYYCNQDAQNLASGSGIVGADKKFKITFVLELVRGTRYKIGLQTERGYAESEFTA